LARPDSDLDLALELEPAALGESGLNWLADLEGWKAALAPLLPFALDLQVITPHDETVGPAVKREGILVYAKP